jgi:ABC-2 type transport system permease protein
MRLWPMLLFQLILPQNMRMAPPDSLQAFLQFAVSLLLGVVCLCEINAIMNAVIMKTLDQRGIAAMINLVMMALSGNVIPLTLFPDRLQALIRYQPFAQALDAPIRMYQHTQALPEWLLSLGVQLAWILILRAVGRWMWQRRLDRMIVQGG